MMTLKAEKRDPQVKAKKLRREGYVTGILSGKEMKEFDARSIKGYGIPSLVLMERAAMAVAEKAEEILEKEEAGTVWSVCGFGNNGADGVAAARMLFLKGYDVKIVFPQRDGKGSKELEAQLNVVKRLGIPVMTAEDLPDLVEKKIPAQPFRKAGERKRSCRGVILDAIFGIGLSRNVEGAYRKLIRWINGQEDMKVIAVDIPSGISSDNGSVMGDAVRADVTVTFGEKKLGQVLFPGRELCGHLLVKDVGFVPESSAEREKHVQMLDREDLLRIPARMADSNKGTYGKVLVMAGAKNMAGASLLSARAAYRMGAGLVKVFTPEENRLIVQEKLPKEEELYDLAELYKVFGDSTRIKILYVLFEAELCVCDIAQLLNMTQSAISHQLRILKQNRLVKNRRDGKSVFYSLADGHVKTIISQGMEHIQE